MSVYRRPESRFYVIEIRWQGLPRLKLSAGTTRRKRAQAMERTLYSLKDAGRFDVHRLLAEGKLRIADVHEEYVRDPQDQLGATRRRTAGEGKPRVQCEQISKKNKGKEHSQSCRTRSVNSSVLILSSPLYSINPIVLNLFMKCVMRDRVVPTISARVS